MEFADKVVIITGAGSGIGKALARQLDACGARLVLAGRRPEKLHEAAAACGRSEPLLVPSDISKLTDQKHLVQSALARHGRIDVLINNAGVVYAGPVTSVRPEEVDHQLRVNVLAPIWLTQLTLPILRQQANGMIVNIASIAAMLPVPCHALYCASKHALHGFSEAVRRELLGGSIRVVTVYPGNVASELVSEAVERRMKELKVRAKVMSAEAAAKVILAGMRKERSRVFVTGPMDRALVRLNQIAPELVARQMASAKQRIAGVLEVVTEGVRQRNALAKVD